MDHVTEESFKAALTRHAGIEIEEEVSTAANRALGALIDHHRSNLETVVRELAQWDKAHARHPNRPKDPRHLAVEREARLAQHVIALIQKRRDQVSAASAAARANLEAVRPLIASMRQDLDRSEREAWRTANPRWSEQNRGAAHP